MKIGQIYESMGIPENAMREIKRMARIKYNDHIEELNKYKAELENYKREYKQMVRDDYRGVYKYEVMEAINWLDTKIMMLGRLKYEDFLEDEIKSYGRG